MKKNEQEEFILYSIVRWFTVILIIIFLMKLTDHYTDIYLNEYKSLILFLSGWFGLIIYEELFLKYRK